MTTFRDEVPSDQAVPEQYGGRAQTGHTLALYYRLNNAVHNGRCEFHDGGELVLVFDDGAWREHHDVGDNSIFYRPAKIVRAYRHGIDKALCVDVRWLGTNRISLGHFASGLLEWPKEGR